MLQCEENKTKCHETESWEEGNIKQDSQEGLTFD